ncbi:MAG: hypothetical protein Q8P02_04715 [Candidatus Micrarchaeota archaeon]|nr:hypothetical protein [Candidatus Micrarchaeota archaeon]
MRGQLFSTDFLASVLVMTVFLGIFLHTVEIPASLTPGAPREAALVSQAVLSGTGTLALNASLVAQSGSLCPVGSHAYCYDVSFLPHLTDLPAQNASLSFVTENGVPLGPAHAAAVDVQAFGGGRFWDVADAGASTLVFSSSDGSDPRTNGLAYALQFTTADAAILNRTCLLLESDGRSINAICPSGCRAVDAVDRYVDCGGARCIFSVRSCA